MIVGFSLLLARDRVAGDRHDRMLHQVLGLFPWIRRHSVRVGSCNVELWGHDPMTKRMAQLPDGSLVFVVGGPKELSGLDSLAGGEDALSDWARRTDGRFVLVRVSADGNEWMMVNDWVGSIPVYHAVRGGLRVAGTLERVAVAAAGLTEKDVDRTALLSLLLNGHLLGDQTVYSSLLALPADTLVVSGGDGVVSRCLWSVAPSDKRWSFGWRELVEEMHACFLAALKGSLEGEDAWVLPLSGGLDSRLIAAAGAELGLDVHSYTYTPTDVDEASWARQIAKQLSVPWQTVPIPPDSSERFTQRWLEWFGASLHCHGMYMFPFLEVLRQQGSIAVLGFLGDALCGGHLDGFLNPDRWSGDTLAPLYAHSVYWSPSSLSALLKGGEWGWHVEKLRDQMQSMMNDLRGSTFQKQMLLDVRHRQRRFISFQPIMLDYYGRVATPYMARRWADFCFSLPLSALGDRRLQKAVISEHYPRLARIGGTFGRPAKIGLSYLVGRLGARVSRAWKRGAVWHQTVAAEGCGCGTQPIMCAGLLGKPEVRSRMGAYLDMKIVERVVCAARKRGGEDLKRLQPLQTLAFVLDTGVDQAS